jgi:SAM-dependent methyltransferase
MPNARQTPVNKSHSSLGPNLRPGRLASARRTFERLLTYGIRPDDTVVDYGCGTLRLGTLFIEYLQADRYIGLDIDKRILAAGREQLADDIVENQAPDTRGHLQGRSGTRGGQKSALGLLQVVLQHVPPEELDDYFAGLSPLIHAGATGLLFSYIGPESRRMSLKTWVHDFDQLRGRQRPRHGTWPAEVEGTFMELRAANGPMT